MKLGIHVENWPAKRPFRIAGREFLDFEVVVVELERDGFVGRGEGFPVFYLGDSCDAMVARLEAVARDIERCTTRAEVRSLLPACAARNALDCALWDLEAKSGGTRIWDLAAVTPRMLRTVYTIGLEPTPEAMAAHAAEAHDQPLLKVKLGADRPLERLRAIRDARPDARVVVDANQAWTFDQLTSIAPDIAALGVEMLEQPLPRGADDALAWYRSPVPLAADESCQHVGELGAVARGYSMVNVKLDKTGGLTHALELVAAARAGGLGVMVGCMGGTSLAMAPAFVAGCLADLVDIDGPLLLRRDRPPGLRYDAGEVRPFDANVWG
jgi:L-alanine-DL-glutamate epimerase-like enolase superfamily enzyme